MKAKLERYLRWLREGFLQMLRLHPVESALTVYACAGCLLTYELDWDHSLPKLALAALFFAVALVVNNLAGRGPWRRVYWVSWTPIVPLSLWGGLEAWIVSEPAFLTFGILVPLALLMCRRAVHNERFVCDALLWLRSGVLAVFFANVALGLFGAILFSTTYIFGLEGAWIDHVWTYALIVFETFAVPVLFLMMADRWREARVREQPHSRNPAQLHRRSGAADLYGHSLPLHGQNPRYVVAARRRRRLSRVRIHAFRAGREGAAVPDAEAALRLVFRPVQPDLAADAAPVLGRCDSPYERIPGLPRRVSTCLSAAV